MLPSTFERLVYNVEQRDFGNGWKWIFVRSSGRVQIYYIINGETIDMGCITSMHLTEYVFKFFILATISIDFMTMRETSIQYFLRHHLRRTAQDVDWILDRFEIILRGRPTEGFQHIRDRIEEMSMVERAIFYHQIPMFFDGP